jgi:hypothetical protein
MVRLPLDVIELLLKVPGINLLYEDKQHCSPMLLAELKYPEAYQLMRTYHFKKRTLEIEAENQAVQGSSGEKRSKPSVGKEMENLVSTLLNSVTNAMNIVIQNPTVENHNEDDQSPKVNAQTENSISASTCADLAVEPTTTSSSSVECHSEVPKTAGVSNDNAADESTINRHESSEELVSNNTLLLDIQQENAALKQRVQQLQSQLHLWTGEFDQIHDDTIKLKTKEHYKAFEGKVQHVLQKVQEKLQEFKKAEDEMKLCRVCREHMVSVLLFPCGHCCICGGCVGSVVQGTNQCPLCKQDILSTLQLGVP